MENRIFDIGTGRYKSYRRTLNAFIEESEKSAAAGAKEPPATRGGANEVEERERQRLFDEVIDLFRAYMRSESIDLLVQLKCKLEDASVRYQSHVLAQEVLNINSCLPYDRRVPTPKEGSSQE